MLGAFAIDLLDSCFPPRCVACDERPPLADTGRSLPAAWASRAAPGAILQQMGRALRIGGLCRRCLRALPDAHARCAACGRRVGPALPAGAPARVGCARCTGPLAEADALTWRGGFPASQGGLSASQRGTTRRALAGVVAPWSYGGVPRDLVLGLKFHRRQAAAGPLGAALAEALRAAHIPGDLVAHVPLSFRRRRSRGYDQAGLLAAQVARRLGLEHARHALRRRRHTAPQTSLARSVRQRGPRGAFSARRRWVRGRCVILVDDVLTSGATAKACALALRRAGALAVVAAVACRAERAART